MNIIQKSLAMSTVKNCIACEKTLQYFDRSTKAKAERVVNVFTRIANVLK